MQFTCLLGSDFQCADTSGLLCFYYTKAFQFFSELNKLRQEETGGTIPIWHALKIPLFLTCIYSLIEDQQYTNLVLLQSDIFETIKFQDNVRTRNSAT